MRIFTHDLTIRRFYLPLKQNSTNSQPRPREQRRRSLGQFNCWDIFDSPHRPSWRFPRGKYFNPPPPRLLRELRRRKAKEKERNKNPETTGQKNQWPCMGWYRRVMRNTHNVKLILDKKEKKNWIKVRQKLRRVVRFATRLTGCTDGVLALQVSPENLRTTGRILKTLKPKGILTSAQ